MKTQENKIKETTLTANDEWGEAKKKININEERMLKEFTVSIRMSATDKEKLNYIMEKLEFDSNTDTIRWVIRIIYLVIKTSKDNFSEFLMDLGRLCLKKTDEVDRLRLKKTDELE